MRWYVVTLRSHVVFCKVVFCRVRANHTRVFIPGTRGIYPGYCPTKNFCKFCRTFTPVPGNLWKFCGAFIPVPGISASSVRPWPQYPGYGYSTFCARSVKSVSSVRPVTILGASGSCVRLTYPYPDFCKFCKIPIPLPGTSVTSVTSVRLWRNTRGTGMPLLQYPGSPVFVVQSE